MANSKSNYPAAQLGDLEPDFVSETIENLRQLNSKGKPKTDQEPVSYTHLTLPTN